MNELVTQTANAVATPGVLNQEQKDLLWRTIATGAKRPPTNDEMTLFFGICESSGLDPFRKQIYPIWRWSRGSGETLTAQVAIDGFRVMATRTGEYGGQTPPEWCGDDGVWKEVWLTDKPPAAARVGVIRKGHEQPTYAVARWGAYVQKTKGGEPTKFWASMGDVMLSKCAESLALRKAFPEQLSGLYTREEMQQDTTEEIEPKGLSPATAAIAETRGVKAEPTTSHAMIGTEGTTNLAPWADPNWSGEVDLTSHIPMGHLKGMPWAACGEPELPLLRKMRSYGGEKGLFWWVSHAEKQIQIIDEALIAQRAEQVGEGPQDEAVIAGPKPPHDRKAHYADRAKARLKQLVKFVSPRAVSSDHSGDISKLTIGTGMKLAAWINEQWGEAVINPDGFKEWWAAISHEHLSSIKGFLVDAGADLEGK